MKILNNNRIKTTAMILMTIDHIGYIFELDPIFRIIGRLSFPLFAFLIYEGFRHTSNISRYFKRLFVFGVVLQSLVLLANQFMPLANLPINVFLTLSFGLLGLLILDSNERIFIKIIGIIALAYISEKMNFDYGWYGIILITSFYFMKYNILIPLVIQIIINYLYFRYFNFNIQYYALLSWFIIILYNEKLGNKRKQPYIMYYYYPLHLLSLFLIKMYFFT